MAKITIKLPGGLVVVREVSDEPAAKSSGPRVPAFAANPQPVEKPQKSILEKAAKAVEEVVKPKRRGRPRKKPAAE